MAKRIEILKDHMQSFQDFLDASKVNWRHGSGFNVIEIEAKGGWFPIHDKDNLKAHYVVHKKVARHVHAFNEVMEL